MRYLVVAFVVLLIFFLALPPMAHMLVERELTARIGETHIGGFDLNIIRGRVNLSDITVDGVAGSDLSDGALSVDLDMAELLRGELIVESLGGQGLNLVIEEDEHGHLVVLLAPHPAQDEAPQEPLVLPRFRINELWLKDSVVQLSTSLADGHFTVSSLALSNLSSETAEAATIALRADWDGARITVDGEVFAFAAEPAFEGKVRLEQLDLLELAALLPPEFEHLEVSGLISAAVDTRLAVGEQVLLELAGNLSLAGLEVEDGARELTLIGVEAARVESIQLTSDYGVSLATLEIEGMAAVNSHSEEGQWLQAREITLLDLDYADGLLRVTDMRGSGLRSVLRLTADGELVSQGVLGESLKALAGSVEDSPSRAAEGSPSRAAEGSPSQAAEGSSSTATEGSPSQAAESSSSTAAEGEAGIGFEYALLNISARDSELLFRDEQFSPPIQLQLKARTLDIASLDSRQPEAGTTVALDALVGEYGAIELEGTISPLSEQIDLDMKGEIEQMRLSLVSPYLESLLGYEMTAGQYDHVFDIKLADNRISASNQLQLRSLKVQKLEGAEPGVALPVPLGFALGLLRDSDGHIDLDVPLEGDLSDPEVGLNQIVGKALGKALAVGSTSLLKLALQPYGAIWAGAEAGLKLATKMHLDPMSFTPGSVDLGEQQAPYADKLAALLKDREGIKLTLCGIAGAADLASLVPGSTAAQLQEVPEDTAAQLKTLAQTRQENLKRYLAVNRQVDTKRLYLCKPRVEPASKISGVLLGL